MSYNDRWISVDDRLPDKYSAVPVFTVNGDLTYAYHDGKDWFSLQSRIKVATKIEYWYDIPLPTTIRTAPALKDWPSLKWAAKDRHGQWYLYVDKPEYDSDFNDWFVGLESVIVPARQVGWEPPANMKDVLPQDSLIKLDA